MDAGVVAVVVLSVFVGAGGESVVCVADGWSYPVVVDADGYPFCEVHVVGFGEYVFNSHASVSFR